MHGLSSRQLRVLAGEIDDEDPAVEERPEHDEVHEQDWHERRASGAEDQRAHGTPNDILAGLLAIVPRHRLTRSPIFVAPLRVGFNRELQGMHCFRCGFALQDRVRYCGQCGVELPASIYPRNGATPSLTEGELIADRASEPGENPINTQDASGTSASDTAGLPEPARAQTGQAGTSAASHTPTIATRASHRYGLKHAPYTLNRERTNSPSMPVGSSKVGPVGVGGWLAFFCVGLTIVAPIVALGQAVQSWSEARPSFSNYPSLQWAVIIEGLGFLGLAGYGFIVGIKIWSGDKNGRALAKRFLLIRVVGFVAIELGVLMTIQDLPSAVVSDAFAGAVVAFFAQLAIAVGWWIYFESSRRVQNTYG